MGFNSGFKGLNMQTFNMVVTKFHCYGSGVMYLIYLCYRSAIFPNQLTEDSILKVDIHSGIPKIIRLLWKLKVYCHMALL